MTRSASHPSRRALTIVTAGAMFVGAPGCVEPGPRANERWVTTQDTTVDIDWDAVGRAYREAEGPEDFERRVNEIYAGDEIISVAVRDVDAHTQEVTGFFDRNADGQVAPNETVFTLRRDVTGPEAAQYQIQGHGAYAGYRSPMWDVASGMAMGYMISRAFSPGYVPVYTRPYVTAPARRTALVSQRNAYRTANPSKVRPGPKSRSGRTYGQKGSQFGGGKPRYRARPAPRRSFGGGRFGRRRAPSGDVVRLTV